MTSFSTCVCVFLFIFTFVWQCILGRWMEAKGWTYEQRHAADSVQGDNE